MINLLFVITATVMVMLVGTSIYHYRKIKQLQRQLSDVTKDCEVILRDHPSLVGADLFFSRQLKEINNQLISMDQQIQNLENIRSNDGGYQHALGILEMGGSRDDIVESCHLSNAEAELLMNLQAYRSAIKAKTT